MQDSLTAPGMMPNEYFSALVHMQLEDENSDVSKIARLAEAEIEADELE